MDYNSLNMTVYIEHDVYLMACLGGVQGLPFLSVSRFIWFPTYCCLSTHYAMLEMCRQPRLDYCCLAIFSGFMQTH